MMEPSYETLEKRAEAIGKMSWIANEMRDRVDGPMALSFLAEYLVANEATMSRTDRALLMGVGATLIIIDWPNMEQFAKNVPTH